MSDYQIPNTLTTITIALLLSKHGNALGNFKTHVLVTEDINLFPPWTMFYEPDNTAVLSVCTFTYKTKI